MKRSLFFLALSATSIFAAVGCAAPTDEEPTSEEAVEEGLTGNPSNFGYFVVTRHDMRKCMSPICGGVFVKRVNQDKTRCADGSMQAECYVSAVELKNVGLSAREEADFRGAVESGKAVVKGAIYKKTWNGTVLGTLKANEGWLGATGSTADGTFYRAAANDIKCVVAPCPTTTVYELNGHDDHNVIKVNLDNTADPASPEDLERAKRALATKQGILIAGGVALPKCMPGSNCGPFATASEFYLRVESREGKSCGGRGMTTCNAGQFCQWTTANMCGAFDAAGKCAYRPDVCAKVFKPVCGCDGKTYGNECEAAAGGTSVSKTGACP